MEVCARLVSADNSVSISDQSEASILTVDQSQVPYMAAIIWVPGTPVNTAVVDSLMSSPVNPGDSERYFQCADRMMAAVTGGGGEIHHEETDQLKLSLPGPLLQEEMTPVYSDEMVPSSSFLQDHSFLEEDLEELQMRNRMLEIQEKKQRYSRGHYDDDGPGPSSS